MQDLLPMPLFKGEDNETTSLSSHDSQKRKSTVLVKELRSNIRSQIAKNQAKLQEVLRENPMYTLQLFEPMLDKAVQNSTELLAIKLDRLMEDEYALDKELNRIAFRRQHEQEAKDYEVSNHMNHFAFLQNAWKKTGETNSTEERIDAINHAVGSIKGHIRHLSRVEGQNTQVIADMVKDSQ